MGEVTPIFDNTATKVHGLKPWSLETEQAVLGIILYENEKTCETVDQYDAAIFYDRVHQRIFAAVKELVRMRKTADPLTVYHHIEQDEALDELGGHRYLMDLVDKCPGFLRLKDYFEVLTELWRRRELMDLGNHVEFMAKDGDATSEIINHVEKSMLALAQQTVGISLVGADLAVDRVMQQLDHPELASGVKIGLSPIDDVSGGFMPGELWLGAGRPGAGKSAIASSGSLHVARHGLSPDGKRLGVVNIGSEMTVEQQMRRHIADLACEMFGVAAPCYSTIRKRMMTAEQRQMFNAAAAELRKLGTLKCLYRTGLTVNALRGIIRRQITSWAREGVKPGLVTIDHVGLLRSSANARSRTESQGEVAREMKELAGELEVPIFALVQLNRQVELRDDKRPTLSDLRDSGEWEENADGVIGVYRDSYYAQREPEPKRDDKKMEWEERKSSRLVDAIFMKIREGEMQTVKLWADMGRNAIRGDVPSNFHGAHAFDFGYAARMLDPDQALPSAYGGEFD